MSECFKPELLYPTFGDVSHPDIQSLAKLFHFILLDKQICLTSCRGQLVIKVFGYKPDWYNGLNVRYDNWYWCWKTDYKNIHLAIDKFRQMCLELLMSEGCFYPKSWDN